MTARIQTRRLAELPFGGAARITERSIPRQTPRVTMPMVGRPASDPDETAWQALLAACAPSTVQRGDFLYRAGDHADGLYILVNGRLRLLDRTADGDVEMTAGAIVGAEAVFSATTRDHDAVATRDSRLLFLDRAAFVRLCQDHPGAAIPLTRSIVGRLERRVPASRPARGGRTIAVAPLGRDVPAHAFARRLRDALAADGIVLHLHPASLDERMEQGAGAVLEDSQDDQRVAAWLNDLEGRHDVVLYETDVENSPWTRRCLRQADHVVFVANADSDPALRSLELLLADEEGSGTAVRRTLVLLHPADRAEPRGTAAWLAVRRVDEHHHVWLGRPSSIECLARHLTGRATGLVLGSGGARCFAHLGVLRALREAGIVIDAIGGVSLGALIAAHAALGSAPEETIARARALAASRAPLRSTLPLMSVFRASGLNAMLGDEFGERRIEDLTLPFFCASSNLHTGRLMLHRSGPLAHYLRATCSAPGLLPPVLDGGDLLVDGAVLNAVPVRAMREVCKGGNVIAVDVSAEASLRRDYDFGAAAGGWHMLMNRVNPLARRKVRAPSIVSVLMRSAELSSVYHGDVEVRTADVYIRPPVSAYKMFDVRHLEVIVEHGYRAAITALEQWQRDGRAVMSAS